MLDEENKPRLKPMPKARVSFLPVRSGDGYGYGGGAIVSFDGAAVEFGEGNLAATAAKQVARAVNAHDALVDALMDAEAVIRSRYADEYQMLLKRIKDALSLSKGVLGGDNG